MAHHFCLAGIFSETPLLDSSSSTHNAGFCVLELLIRSVLLATAKTVYSVQRITNPHQVCLAGQYLKDLWVTAGSLQDLLLHSRGLELQQDTAAAAAAAGAHTFTSSTSPGCPADKAGRSAAALTGT
jgi:hypothetical protein